MAFTCHTVYGTFEVLSTSTVPSPSSRLGRTGSRPSRATALYRKKSFPVASFLSLYAGQHSQATGTDIS
uniref:Uncharacterized protein n=1 Tax=Haemonchus contortus TaxID=6289 RepID=A0A7I4YXT5_HAECO